MSSNNEQIRIDYSQYYNQAISYEEYKNNFQLEIDGTNPSPYAEYLPQNWQRQSRLDRKLALREDVLQALSNLSQPLNWLVISEHWCGDASQINPIINKAALESDGKISLRFVYRDQNEQLIDAHLTDGRSRSIPIILQLDDQHQLLNSYGPRPAEAQKIVKSFLAKGESYNIPLHTWYAKDKQQSVQDDLIRLIQSAG